MGRDRLVIAVDGPAGSGKSTIAKRIAHILEMEYIDTGAMYRALTLKVIRENIDSKDIRNILKLLETTSIYFKNNHIYLDDIMVDDEIRKNIINKNVSDIAKIAKVREKMVESQQKLSESYNVIMDGRDIGTVVLPKANFKFFIIASIEERARRRYEELMEKNEENISYNKILDEIKKRDNIDSTRENSPLRKSPESYEIDNTNKTIDESIDEILHIIREAN